MTHKILPSDKTKIDLFAVNAKCLVGKRPFYAHQQADTIPTVKHVGGTITLWRCFFSSRNWETGQDRGECYKDEILIESALDLRLLYHFILQQNDSN